MNDDKKGWLQANICCMVFANIGAGGRALAPWFACQCCGVVYNYNNYRLHYYSVKLRLFMAKCYYTLGTCLAIIIVVPCILGQKFY